MFIVLFILTLCTTQHTITKLITHKTYTRPVQTYFETKINVSLNETFFVNSNLETHISSNYIYNTVTINTEKQSTTILHDAISKYQFEQSNAKPDKILWPVPIRFIYSNNQLKRMCYINRQKCPEINFNFAAFHTFSLMYLVSFFYSVVVFLSEEISRKRNEISLN